MDFLDAENTNRSQESEINLKNMSGWHETDESLLLSPDLCGSKLLQCFGGFAAKVGKDFEQGHDTLS